MFPKASLAVRKTALKQALLSPTGKLLPPAPEPQVQPAKPKAKSGFASSSRDQSAAIVQLFTPNHSGELSTVIEGTISGRIYRKKSEATVSFWKTGAGSAITVKGKIPVVDTGLKYTIEVSHSWFKGKQIYRFQKICPGGLVALPVNGMELRTVLQTKLKLVIDIANAVALQIAGSYVTAVDSKSIIEKLKSAEIPIAHIYDNFVDQLWYQPLLESWPKLKYRFYPELLHFWSFEELSCLSLSDLAKLHERLLENPVNFCLESYYEGRLPAIKPEKFSSLRAILKVEFTTEMEYLVVYFNKITEWILQTKCLIMTIDDVREIAEKSVPPEYSTTVLQMALSTKYSLLCTHHEPLLAEDPNRRGNSLVRFYRYRDFIHLRIMKSRLSQILSRSPDCILPLEGISRPILTDEQELAIRNIIENVNALLLSGDGGTGKTLTASTIYTLYGANRCLPVAAYTGLATRNQRQFSKDKKARGLTIDLVIESIVRGTKQGKKIASCTEVLLLDECGVVDLHKFSRLLELLPNLKKIFMTGDVKQSRPVSAGRVLDGLLASWKNTDHIVYLTVNKRVQDGFSVLIDNFRHFLNGDFRSMVFTTDLLSEIPFKILKRQKHPNEYHERIDSLVRELRPIYHWVNTVESDSSQIRIITHAHYDVDLLNIAWSKLSRSGRPYTDSTSVFYPGDLVRFKEPFVHRYLGETQVVPEHLACDPVCTNNVAQISEIYDISKTASMSAAYHSRKVLDSTAAPYVSDDSVRVIKFVDGTQINLREYPITKIVLGNATTILSSIGHECNYVIVWVPEWQKHFYRELMYTAITRAKKGVVVVADISPDLDIAKSDIAKIWKNLPPPIENGIAAYVPRQGAIESDTLDDFISKLQKIREHEFNPSTEVEKRQLENNLSRLESRAPIIGDDTVDIQTERILQHVKAQRSSLLQSPTLNESQTLVHSQTLPDEDEFVDYDYFSQSREPSEPKSIPKRHFGFIDNLPGRETYPVEREHKRLKKNIETEILDDDAMEWFGESEVNPFEVISDLREKRKHFKNVIED